MIIIATKTKYIPTIIAPLLLLNPFLKYKRDRAIIDAARSHQTEKTVRFAKEPRPNIVAGTHIPNRIFRVLLFRDSLITAIPLPSRANLIVVITLGILVKVARISIPRIVLFTPHTSLRKTAELTIPMLDAMITITAGTPNHTLGHDFFMTILGPFEACLVEAIATTKNV
jgi:hypothetical protein